MLLIKEIEETINRLPLYKQEILLEFAKIIEAKELDELIDYFDWIEWDDLTAKLYL